jgi:hypothetical protein
MWWSIGLFLIVVVGIRWCVCAGKPKEDDYADQMAAIKAWQDKKDAKNKG